CWSTITSPPRTGAKMYVRWSCHRSGASPAGDAAPRGADAAPVTSPLGGSPVATSAAGVSPWRDAPPGPAVRGTAPNGSNGGAPRSSTVSPQRGSALPPITTENGGDRLASGRAQTPATSDITAPSSANRTSRFVGCTLTSRRSGDTVSHTVHAGKRPEGSRLP